MIRYLPHNEIDKARWDRCIEGASNRIIYALSWYLDIVSPGWDALVKDDYESVMPLTWKKRWGLKYLVQPAFCQQLGVFTNTMEIIGIDDFIMHIPREFLRFRIQLNKSNSITNRKIKTVNKINFELELRESYSSLFNNFSGNHKKNIKNGRNKNITIEKTSDLTSFFNFFTANHINKFKLGEKAYEVLEKILYVMQSRNCYELYFAYSDNGKPAGAIYLIKEFDRWILLITVADEQGKRKKAVYLLLDHFIHIHAGSNEILDFEGSTLKGVAEFFKGFGAEAFSYLYISGSRLPLF